MKKNHAILATLAILITALLWGITFTFIKISLRTLTPFNFLFWRFGIASLLMFIIFWKKIKLNQQTLLYGILLGIFLGGTVIFQTVGLWYTTVSTASFLTGLAVVLVALSEAVLKKRRPSIYLTGSTVLAIAGIGLITLENGTKINEGDLWILLCAFCFASYILFAGEASHIHEAFSLIFIQFAVIGLVTGITSLLTTGISIPQHIDTWVAILFCSVFASVIAYILQLKFQKYVSSTKAAIIFSLEPVFATITAAIYLHEHLSLQFFTGALMIFFAILFAEKGSKHPVMPQD